MPSTCSHDLRKMEGKAAGRSEAVERIASCVPRRGEIVLPLIEIDAGLLPLHKIGVPAKPVHRYLDSRRNVTRYNLRLDRQLFSSANRDVVSGDDAFRREQFLQARDDFRLRSIHALVEGLHRQVIAVAVDDQGGQQIAFRVDDPVGIGVRHNPLPTVLDRRRQAVRVRNERSIVFRSVRKQT